jgi:hypothetical protein
MAQESLENTYGQAGTAVEILEQLPERVTAVESQIVLLRDEMRSEFSAVRGENSRRRRAGHQDSPEEIRAGEEQNPASVDGNG